ncbi:MAG: sulfatase/phosphatase domain-containing protein [Planctomycetota bacterium]
MVDLVQTIAAIGGACCPDDWDGSDMLSWLDDAQHPWKDCALSDYYGHNICSGMTMYRAGRYKYIYHARADATHGPERELYDLTTDPQEQQDLADEPQHAQRVAQLHAALCAELGEDPEAIEQRCRAELAAGCADLGPVGDCGSERISCGGGLLRVR